MDKRTKIAVAVVAACLLAAGLIIYFHQPPKQGGIRQGLGVPEVVGVGILIRLDPQTHELVVQQVVPGSPAARAGITNGLIVSKVDSNPMQGRPLAQCVNLIRGPVGTTVQLELVTPDRSQTNSVELTRQKLKL
ncbi:MAG: PDZ domain-containing protein [Verrucomicrobiota bacterium]|jgi:C-terminal processing protease CtpA/Prc